MSMIDFSEIAQRIENTDTFQFGLLGTYAKNVALVKVTYELFSDLFNRLFKAWRVRPRRDAAIP